VSKSALFADGIATDPSYINIRDAGNAHTQQARKNCEGLWEMFEPYADKEFPTEIRNNFDARYWEMYLATYLMREGYEVYAPNRVQMLVSVTTVVAFGLRQHVQIAVQIITPTKCPI